MDNSIPEINYSLELLSWLQAEIKKNYPDLEVSEISFVDRDGQRVVLTSFEELDQRLHKLRPTYRDKVKITFEISPPPQTKNKPKAHVYFGYDGSGSKIELNGPKKTKEKFGEQISNLLSLKRRSCSNLLGRGISIPVTIFFAGLPYLFGSVTSFENSRNQGIATALIGLPAILYFYVRPHSFYISNFMDHLHLLVPTLKTTIQLIKTTLISVLTILFVSNLPIVLKLDQYAVVYSQSAQREVLREILGTHQLEKIQALKAATKQYDKAENEEERQGSYVTMVTYLNSIVGQNGFLQNVPIGKLPVFVSSAKDLRGGNWLQETPLLALNADPKDKSFLYTPRILNAEMANEKMVDVGIWSDQIILKDKFGKTWSRKELLQDLGRELSGHAGIESEGVKRLRKFPEDKIQFVIKDSIFNTAPQNSVVQESVRAISEEILRSYNVMQRDLSGNPDVHNKK